MRLEKTDFERAARKMVRIARCIKKMVSMLVPAAKLCKSNSSNCEDRTDGASSERRGDCFKLVYGILFFVHFYICFH